MIRSNGTAVLGLGMFVSFLILCAFFSWVYPLPERKPTSNDGIRDGYQVQLEQLRGQIDQLREEKRLLAEDNKNLETTLSAYKQQLDDNKDLKTTAIRFGHSDGREEQRKWGDDQPKYEDARDLARKHCDSRKLTGNAAQYYVAGFLCGLRGEPLDSDGTIMR